ncbi:arylesterase [Gracilimonas amylolytica]|uniref:arylesterase n=1 Tax=Gracilimonas amylolytica TaxID=1749045 RepID=UPI000CD9C79E|nr:arylesterase [Gracilimonas amylolytica]
MRTLVAFLIFIAFTSLSAQSQNSEEKRILFFGDSITAGLGVDKSQAFPALIQQKIDSAGINYEVINGGLSGETSAGGLRRIDWVMQKPVDIFVLELGGNDALRGIDLGSTKDNLQQIIDKVQEKYPEVQIYLAGMQVPPNLGQEYTSNFQKMYPELAEENDLPLIPMMLEKIGGSDIYMQEDGIHPTPAGHRIIAESIWNELSPILH